MRATLVALVLIGCEAPGPEGIECEPTWQGTQIGEPDCRVANEIIVALVDGEGAEQAGTVTWRYASCPPLQGTVACVGTCSVLDVPPGDIAITAEVDGEERAAVVTLDEADAWACDTCCDTVLYEEIVLTF